MKRLRSMKAKLGKITIGLCLMLGICTGHLSINQVAAASKGNLNITGNSVSVTQSQRNGKTKVNFTFKTTGTYTGFQGGMYYILYDASQMDLVANSVKQYDATINYSVTDVNGDTTPSVVAGAVYVVLGALNPSQDYNLEMEFTNLFKDGKNRPAEIKIVKDATDDFSVGDPSDPLGFSTIPDADVVIKSATISLPTMSVNIAGRDNLAKGASTTYTATVTEGLANTGVTWGLAGQTSSNTEIDGNGRLMVGADETATQVTLTATSKEDGTKKATKIVKIEDKKYTVKSIELPITSITEQEGITETELCAIADKNETAKVTVTTNAGESVTVNGLVKSYESDKEVVDADGKIIVGKFNFIYTIELPYVETDNNGKIIVEDNTKATNVLGTNTVKIPVEIKAKSTTPEIVLPKDPIISEDKGNGSSGTNETLETKGESTKKPVITGDRTTTVVAVAGLVLSGFGAVIATRKKRRASK